jgi:hypothetical protein
VCAACHRCWGGEVLPPSLSLPPSLPSFILLGIKPRASHARQVLYHCVYSQPLFVFLLMIMSIWGLLFVPLEILLRISNTFPHSWLSVLSCYGDDSGQVMCGLCQAHDCTDTLEYALRLRCIAALSGADGVWGSWAEWMHLTAHGQPIVQWWIVCLWVLGLAFFRQKMLFSVPWAMVSLQSAVQVSYPGCSLAALLS